jgi:hypothetical protein
MEVEPKGLSKQPNSGDIEFSNTLTHQAGRRSTTPSHLRLATPETPSGQRTLEGQTPLDQRTGFSPFVAQHPQFNSSRPFRRSNIRLAWSMLSVSSARIADERRSRLRPRSSAVNYRSSARLPAFEIGHRAVPLKIFTKFKQLPLELQIMIWKMAVPRGRVIEMDISEDGRIFKAIDSAVPAVLQACRTSRTAALQILRPRFHTLGMFQAYTYVDVEFDVIKLKLDSAKNLALTRNESVAADRRAIKHVELVVALTINADGFYKNLAILVMLSPTQAWPSIQSWHFSGAEDPAFWKHTLQVYVKRPTTDEHSRKGRKIMRRAFQMFFDHARLANGPFRDYGIKVVFL